MPVARQVTPARANANLHHPIDLPHRQINPPTADDICRAIEQDAAAERASGRVLRPRDLAGEPLQCAGGKSQGRAGYCAIHAADGGFPRLGRSVRSDRGAEKFGELSARPASASSAISACRGGLQRRSRAGQRVARRPPHTCRARRAITWRSSPAGRPTNGPRRRRRKLRRPRSRRACRARGWPI